MGDVGYTASLALPVIRYRRRVHMMSVNDADLLAGFHHGYGHCGHGHGLRRPDVITELSMLLISQSAR